MHRIGKIDAAGLFENMTALWTAHRVSADLIGTGGTSQRVCRTRSSGLGRWRPGRNRPVHIEPVATNAMHHSGLRQFGIIFRAALRAGNFHDVKSFWPVPNPMSPLHHAPAAPPFRAARRRAMRAIPIPPRPGSSPPQGFHELQLFLPWQLLDFKGTHASKMKLAWLNCKCSLPSSENPF